MDKLSRISALRPSFRPEQAVRYPARRTAARDRLTELLSAECRGNRLGSHLVVRQWFSSPGEFSAGWRALRCLAARPADELADPAQWLFLDTETTGLAGGTGTYAFLVGVAWWEKGGLAVEQLFMRDHSEEASLLLELARILGERRVLVTFNGKSFDWPLLETRYRMTRAAPIVSPAAHMDLIHPARQLWRLRLGSVALLEIEQHILELDRGPDIPSESIPGRYFDFLRGGPPEPIAEVFRHNQMDLRGLAMLAVRMMSLLEEPEAVECDAGELYGISRLYQRRGEVLLASCAYEKALTLGLPKTAERTAMRELALMARRNRDYRRANTFWEELVGDSGAGLEAYEQLAIHYEHRAREVAKAVSLTHEALAKLREAALAGRIAPHQYRQWHAKLQHRLTRLTTRYPNDVENR